MCHATFVVVVVAVELIILQLYFVVGFLWCVCVCFVCGLMFISVVVVCLFLLKG